MFEDFVILTPTIGRKTLANTIMSIYEQSYQSWTSLIVWDNVEPFINLEGRIDNIKTPKKLGVGRNGAGYVRNYGIEHLIGEMKINGFMDNVSDLWLVFVDDDDTLNRDCLKIVNDYINSGEYIDIYCFSMVDKDTIYPPRDTEIKNLRGYIGIPMAIRFSKLLDTKIRFTPGQYEDWAFLINAEENGLKIKILNEVLYNVKPIDTI